jgi:glycosyltransferase involved in cell wall biosynthesis
MEACASRTAAVTSDVDALGSIYGNHIPIIRSPIEKHLDEFSDQVIRLLSDSEYRTEVNNRAFLLAKSHEWSGIAERLEQILKHQCAMLKS